MVTDGTNKNFWTGKMKIQTAINELTKLGKVVDESYEAVMQRKMPKMEVKGPLFAGIAAYKALNMEGEFKDLDEAYNVVTAYILDEMLKHQGSHDIN